MSNKIYTLTDEQVDAGKVQCHGCGKIFDSIHEMERIYDSCGVYAGRMCSYACAEKHMKINLHCTRADYAENGENLDSDY
jgi:rRNA maturation endonuclease Nob1